MKDLDEQVYRYYWDKSLKDESIDALLNSAPKRRSHWLQVSTAVAAGIALFVAVMWQQQVAQVDLRDLTIREAAMNHTSKLQLDVETSELELLTAKMEKLDFPITLPSQLKDRLSLIGGRYCTINGHLAAHLKFEDKELGGQLSLFMTPATNTLSSLHGQKARLADLSVAVSLAEENGLFYALASADHHLAPSERQ
jgi:hypothetical protein